MWSIIVWIVNDLGWVAVIQTFLLLVVAAVAALRPVTGDAFFSRLEVRLQPLASSRVRQLIVIGFLAFAVRAAFLPFVGPPEPIVHDEHSLLLLGETLSSGRLTNPPHPLWQHFESIHINQQPTYSSIYFIGRGLPQAVGFMLGHPWIGVWLSVIAMCVAICWCIQAWAGLAWAFVVSVIAVLHFATLNYWINSYYGAALTACGGALVIGALPRLLRTSRPRYGWILGLGVGILMTTRPYEGLLLCIPVAAVLLVWLIRHQRNSLAVLNRSLIIPVLLCASLGAALLFSHAKAVTGNATLPPYELNRQQYATAPAFLLAPPYKGPKLGDMRMRKFYEWEQRAHSRRNSVRELATVAAVRVRQVVIFFLTPALVLPFLAGFDLRRCRKSRFLAGAFLVLFVGFLIETWGFPNYFSPGTALALTVVALGFGRLRTWRWRGRASGLFLSRALPLLALVVIIYPTTAALTNIRLADIAPGKYVCCELNSETARAAVNKQLNDLPGRDLVVVSYAPEYDVHVEWIYNSANIDASSVVWARDLGDERNRVLMDYYQDRKIWRLRLVPAKTPRLESYTLANGFAQPVR